MEQYWGQVGGAFGHEYVGETIGHLGFVTCVGQFGIVGG